MTEINQDTNNAIKKPSILNEDPAKTESFNEEEETSGDEEYEDDDLLCTYSATGPNMTFQPIYNCLTCTSIKRANSRNSGDNNEEEDSNDICCICEGCAYICHAEHDVEFIGHAPAYCDCHTFNTSCCTSVEEEGAACGTIQQQQQQHAQKTTKCNGILSLSCCQLMQSSLHVASDLGIPNGGKATEQFVEVQVLPVAGAGSACIPMPLSNEELSTAAAAVSTFAWDYECRAFQIESLFEGSSEEAEPSALCRVLLEQARAMADVTSMTDEVDDDDAYYSNRTYWVPLLNVETSSTTTTTYCEMEMFALSVLKRHVDAYNLEVTKQTGAEWWVQVKPCKSVDEIADCREKHSAAIERNSAVDIHYDKDEKLAQAFGLGYFPVLSTVTYLSSNQSANPTVVFPHTYETAQDVPIDGAVISHAEIGKHLVFDGRLLHGAPAHPRLRRDVDKSLLKRCCDDVRVTFLVNVWMNGKPLDAIELNKDTRAHLRSLSASKPSPYIDVENWGIELSELPISACVVDEVNPCNNDERILLPFISAEAAWIDDKSDAGTYVSMFPPARHVSPTFRIDYGPNFEAWISSVDGDIEE